MINTAGTLPLPSDVAIARHGRTPVNRILASAASSERITQPIPVEDHINTIDIDDIGEWEVRNLGRHLLASFPRGFAIGLSSDYRRVWRSLELALPNLPKDRIIIREELRARSRGDVAEISDWKQRFPEHVALKSASPIDWRPPNGQTLREKASEIRTLLPLMGEWAPDLPAAVFTSGETVIASYVVPEFANMGDVALKAGFGDGWPALAVDNAEYVHYTRRSDPENPGSPLSPTFDYMMLVRAAGKVATNSGWLQIER